MRRSPLRDIEFRDTEPLDRRAWLSGSIVSLAAFAAAGGSGCRRSVAAPARVERIWGRRGISEGRLQRPRAIAIGASDDLYIVDTTGRVQVFTSDGEYVRGWRTPEIEHGRPVGLGVDRSGHVLVADTHYYRLLVYTPHGKRLDDRTIGGTMGAGPGEFGFVTDAVQGPDGAYYVGEYGSNDRIQVFDESGAYVTEWGGHGDAPGQFRRPQAIEWGPDGHLWVSDACNHRIQVFDLSDRKPRLVRCWGAEGTDMGRLRFPYGMAFDPAGFVYVCEFGNQRVQKFTLEGRAVAMWGRPGRRRGELSRPWGVVRDAQGRLHVLDTYNHRVQTLVF